MNNELRKNLMRLDEAEIEERIKKNMFAEDALVVAKDVLKHKKENPIIEGEEKNYSTGKRHAIKYIAIAVGITAYFSFKAVYKKLKSDE